jgi:hypothetical protein
MPRTAAADTSQFLTDQRWVASAQVSETPRRSMRGASSGHRHDRRRLQSSGPSPRCAGLVPWAAREGDLDLGLCSSLDESAIPHKVAVFGRVFASLRRLSAILWEAQAPTQRMPPAMSSSSVSAPVSSHPPTEGSDGEGSAGEPLLELEGLYHKWKGPKQPVLDVSLALHAGQVTWIGGRNGAPRAPRRRLRARMP